MRSKLSQADFNLFTNDKHRNPRFCAFPASRRKSFIGRDHQGNGISNIKEKRNRERNQNPNDNFERKKREARLG